MEENEIKKENVFKKILKKEVIISLIIGLVLGLVLMFFMSNGIIGFSSGKFITESGLYNKMKNYYSIDLVLEGVDTTILNKKYDLSEDEINDLKETADNYIAQYELYYGYTEDEFLAENGFEDYDAFIDYLGIDYKRSLYVYDYLETKLEENAVKNYYDEHAFGKVNTKHILVKTSDTMDEAQAQTIANDIIARLNGGETFDALATEYTTNYSGNVITEDLGEMGAFDNLEEAYVNGMKALETGKYSTEPVKTSYGYHVIYCVEKIEKTEKTEEISNSDRMEIIDVLATEAGMTLDTSTYYKALIQMRKEAGLKFFDKEFKEKYEEYCEPYVEVEEEESKKDETNTTDVEVSLDTEE